MSIHSKTIEAVRERADVLEVVEHFAATQFKASGSTKVTCCPLHGERSGSFHYYPRTNTFKCFGCQKGGDAIQFVMEHKTGGDFEAAIRLIAIFYSIDIQEWVYSKEEKLEVERKTQLQVFTASLQNTFCENKIGIEYFKTRKLKPETLEFFGVGYAAANTVKDFQITPAQKQAIGVLNENEKSVIWDRVTLPIHDEKGNIIAFGGRIYKEEQTGGKWINTRNSELFDKSKTIFNLHRAKAEALKTGKLYITEGYPDVMAMHEIGLSNCVAVCGTQLTDAHCELLAKVFKGKMQYIVVFNNDAKKETTTDGRDAGRDAALRAIPKLLSIGEVKTVRLKSGNDIQEIYQKFDANKVRADLYDAQDAIAYVISELWGPEKENKMRSATEKSELQKQISEIVAKVKDDDVRDIYINDYSDAIAISPKRFGEQVAKHKLKNETKKNIKHEKHIKVLDNFFELQANYDIVNKNSTPVYKRRAPSELEREYGKAYLKSIPRYNDWICEPSHTEFRQTVDVAMDGTTYRFFNEYKPLPYEPKEFELPQGWDSPDFDYETIPQIKATAGFYKHIYNTEKYGNRYVTLGWDYFAIMYLHPHRPLQARCFVSTEEGTGKSTIYNYEQAFYLHNATKTTAKRLIGNFNAALNAKVLIAIEETRDDKGTIENDLKDLITGQEKIVEQKFADAKTVQSFEKYLFLSNHPDSFMKVGTKTTRFAVIDVPSIKTKDNKLLEKMVREIPYVMYFLEKRGVVTPDTDRLWFEPTLWENEALLNLRQASKDVVIKNMEEMIENLFIKTSYTEPLLKLSSSTLQKYMVMFAGRSYEQKQPNYFTDKCKSMGLLCRENPSTYDYPQVKFMPDEESWLFDIKKDKARYIEFPIWKFLSVESIKDNYLAEQIDRLCKEVESKYFHNIEVMTFIEQLKESVAIDSQADTDVKNDDLPF